jgi:Zn-dependent peptidase ImmA (M78 family)
MREEYDFSQGVRGKYVGKVEHRILPLRDKTTWRHPSVRLLAGDGDPVDIVTTLAREIVLAGIDSNVLTIPVDPFKLAELRSVPVIPRPDIRDAQTVAGPNDAPVIEYNPNRPRTRIRFSIFHELAHTLFPDCTAQVRHRLFHSQTSAVDQELEVLCNLAAAEFLFPIGSMKDDVSRSDISVSTALELRSKYEASVESVLLRLVGLSAQPVGAFAAVADEAGSNLRYRLEYIKTTPDWSPGLGRGDYLPSRTIARECTAIDFSRNAEEEWAAGQGKIHVEMVGVAPYPNKVIPRVAGLLRPANTSSRQKPPIHVLRGNALQPSGTGRKIIAHVVNDKTPNWGAGFGLAVQMKWPEAQKHFKQMFERTHGSKMGLTVISPVGQDTFLFQMVCQRSYGPSSSRRLRYEYLRKCLIQLKEAALQKEATIHMPKIGTGEAGGSWGLIYNLIAEELCAKGVSVTVYELPGKGSPRKEQTGLFDDSAR